MNEERAIKTKRANPPIYYLCHKLKDLSIGQVSLINGKLKLSTFSLKIAKLRIGLYPQLAIAKTDDRRSIRRKDGIL
jgi:hypothetical protein